MSHRQAYDGTSRSLVIAFDVGTTFSAVGFALLDPGEIPEIKHITRFVSANIENLCSDLIVWFDRYPGQEGDVAKIPTILYYTQGGEPFAAGAEAAAPAMRLQAEDHDLIFVEWYVMLCVRPSPIYSDTLLNRWKLHLRPSSLSSSEIDIALPLLPPGKDVVTIFADFLRYLFRCTQLYISDTHGAATWDSVADRIQFVFGHPNGWEGAQQGKMRMAAIGAGLVPNTPAGHERVHFATEGEASIHYCIEKVLAKDVWKVRDSV